MYTYIYIYIYMYTYPRSAPFGRAGRAADRAGKMAGPGERREGIYIYIYTHIYVLQLMCVHICIYIYICIYTCYMIYTYSTDVMAPAPRS